ncbi:hypothetical protein [Klenkia sp. PcliD-1-E]|uniref:hypothetical protein n=1 Tax=Klenkia sp. PcliD-1-E TaxID=2954492 RepID=UPI0020976AE1|nr:hypothetical protein [Klenkia sp. PcliD-1-E]MCO7218590.1 hypothetical protein [Klenkia sp. PcliD-1-E]
MSVLSSCGEESVQSASCGSYVIFDSPNTAAEASDLVIRGTLIDMSGDGETVQVNAVAKGDSSFVGGSILAKPADDCGPSSVEVAAGSEVVAFLIQSDSGEWRQLSPTQGVVSYDAEEYAALFDD